jgi:hypothetical protein
MDPSLISIRAGVQNGGFGDYPLHVAARLGDSRMIRLLIRYDADVNVCNLSGETPVMAALLNWKYTQALLLVEEGAILGDMESPFEVPTEEWPLALVTLLDLSKPKRIA